MGARSPALPREGYDQTFLLLTNKTEVDWNQYGVINKEYKYGPKQIEGIFISRIAIFSSFPSRGVDHPVIREYAPSLKLTAALSENALLAI